MLHSFSIWFAPQKMPTWVTVSSHLSNICINGTYVHEYNYYILSAPPYICMLNKLLLILTAIFSLLSLHKRIPILCGEELAPGTVVCHGWTMYMNTFLTMKVKAAILELIVEMHRLCTQQRRKHINVNTCILGISMAPTGNCTNIILKTTNLRSFPEWLHVYYYACR